MSWLATVLLIGQLNMVEHVVDSNAHGAASLYACDLDRDGDLDILAALYEENSIVWWRNDGGSPTQWTRLTIGDNFAQAGSVYAADLDGDSLTDVLGVARVGDEVAWWRNDGGNPIQWTKYTIWAPYDFAHEVYACDLDKDGDIDVLGASTNQNSVTWWRNDGGMPINWTVQTIGTGFMGSKSVHVGDFDQDDTLDVVGAAILDNDVSWWHATGSNPPFWTEYVIDSNFGGAHRVQAIDVNRDGRPDVVGAAYFSGQVAWWRNNGGNPVTWTKQLVGTGFGSACIAQAIDLDGDSDMDVVGTAQSGNQVAWWRNDNNGGEPFVWTKFVIDNLRRVWPLFACDLDQDGDNDVIAASGWAGTNEVKWYENQGAAVTEQPDRLARSSEVPAGVTTVARLRTRLKCRIRDAAGRVCRSAEIGAGVYFLEAGSGTRARVVCLR